MQVQFDMLVGFGRAKKFFGAVPGWVFKLGPRGLWYYRDEPAVAVENFLRQHGKPSRELRLQ